MARKKIVFVIVEGPSDETALGALLSHIFDSNSVFVHIMHRDITTDKGINSQNILAHLGNEVRGYAKSNHFKNSDFQEIIHIVDMDGAYVPENCIIEDTSLTNPVYSTETITAPSAARIIARNRQKSRNLDKLCSSSRLCNIPYRIFYMSCNLDHVLYNKLNCTDVEKENDAYSFALQYRQNTAAFKALICNSDFSVLTGQKESWEFIKSGTESFIKTACKPGAVFSEWYRCRNSLRSDGRLWQEGRLNGTGVFCFINFLHMTNYSSQHFEPKTLVLNECLFRPSLNPNKRLYFFP